MNETVETLELLNPWWKERKVGEELAKPFKREIFDKIFSLTNYRQIVILSGLRRVGKSTILYQIIEELLKKINSKEVIYFNFDKKTEEINKILESYNDLTGLDWKKGKIMVFLDEITKLQDWANKLKLIYDAFPNVKFFLSSSSSLSLEEEAIKNLGGRYFLINIRPLSFKEFLEFKGKKNLLSSLNLYEKEIKKEVEEYFLKCFPEIVDWSDKLLIKDYLRTVIIDKIIKSDLPEKFKNVNKDLLFELLRIFYNQPGLYLDNDSLSKKLRISKRTLIKHIYYLEFSYLIKKIKNFRPNQLSSSKKLQRVYAYWWPFLYCFNDNFDKIMENIVISYLDAHNYWRKGGKELDLIIQKDKKIIPIEVKNKKELLKEDLENIIYFVKKYNIKEGIIVYNGPEDEIILEINSKIKLIPLWKLLLE